MPIKKRVATSFMLAIFTVSVAPVLAEDLAPSTPTTALPVSASEQPAGTISGATIDATNRSSTDDKPSKAPLKGGVATVDVRTTIGGEINRLVDIAENSNEELQNINKKIEYFRTVRSKAAVYSKEVLYDMVPYRGFGPSKQGSRVLLGKDTRMRCLAAAEYFKQKLQDDIHAKTVASMLQIAQALDESDKSRSGEMLTKATDKLSELVGAEEAKKTVESIQHWGQLVSVSPGAYEKQPWDFFTLEQNIKDVSISAANDDPVLRHTAKLMKRYDRSKGMVVLSSVVESATSVAALAAPGLFIPFAISFAGGNFVAATGGCEDTKMLNEIYYEKRMQSRQKRIDSETQMALNSYQSALAQRRHAMLACSESILAELVGPERAERVLGQSVLAQHGGKQVEPLETVEVPVADQK